MRSSGKSMPLADRFPKRCIEHKMSLELVFQVRSYGLSICDTTERGFKMVGFLFAETTCFLPESLDSEMILCRLHYSRKPLRLTRFSRISYGAIEMINPSPGVRQCSRLLFTSCASLPYRILAIAASFPESLAGSPRTSQRFCHFGPLSTATAPMPLTLFRAGKLSTSVPMPRSTQLLEIDPHC